MDPKNTAKAMKENSETNFRVIAVLAIAAAIVVLILSSGCTPKRDASIQIFWNQTPAQKFLSAQAHAKDIDGLFYKVAPTGSMEPYLTAGDMIVVDNKVRFESVKEGWLCTYMAQWLPASSPPATHWAAAWIGNEVIMDGQANEHYENKIGYRMRKQDFEAVGQDGKRVGGRVLAVYTERTK